MTAIPLHLQRRFEQRWASRFTPPAASIAPKNVGTKAPAAKTKEKPTGMNRQDFASRALPRLLGLP
jgi:hypothetical protein